ncbi:hypothetical protein [Elizabethkingia ursingii]|uniref:hypothetical protein n=1 Tax=Elizabethkingia ursingii TaxID=1756150 RepID=UPI0020118C2A|nr:hypothetical protein [Elizabethkingia ursingii]MCL1671690.1 hypothetical protein [Elizabethkingia ursingii]
METFDISIVAEELKGPTKEQIAFYNQHAIVGFDKFHKNSEVEYEFVIDGEIRKIKLQWDSNFSKAGIKEKRDIANFGGVAMAYFVMSILFNYKYVEQSEIGEGVDYRFLEVEPADDDLNFLDNGHYVEISGILEEKGSNTLKNRISQKHSQINNGTRCSEKSSVVVTLLKKPLTIKEVHNEA